MSLQRNINAILNTENVEGVMLFDLTGQVYFEELPINAATEKLPEHILELYNIVAYNYHNCTDLILKFEEKILFFRKSFDKEEKDFVLAVLATAGVDFHTLKLVTNLAMKLIEVDTEESFKEKKGFFSKLLSG